MTTLQYPFEWPYLVKANGEITRTGGPSSGWLNAAILSGVDPTGATDSTTGLLAAIEQGYKENKGIFVPAGKYKVGASGTALDFTTLNLEGGPKHPEETGGLINLELYFDAGAEIIGNAALNAENPVIKMAPPSILGISKNKCKFNSCLFKFGTIVAPNAAVDCIQTWQVSDSLIYINRTFEGRYAMMVECDAPREDVWGNNKVIWNRSQKATRVLNIFSAVANAVAQPQGNQFHFGHIQATSKAIVIDVTNIKAEQFPHGEIAGECKVNKFDIGAIDGGPQGIVDATGEGNQYFGTVVTTEGAKLAFELVGAPSGQPYVRLNIPASVKIELHNKAADLVNLLTGELGWAECTEVNANLKAGEIGEGGKKVACAIVGGQVVLSANFKTTAEIAANSKLFKLPAGFRPVKARNVTAWFTMAIGAATQIIFVEVLPNGEVKNGGKAIQAATYFGFDGAQFPLKVLGE